ncbi:MAG TPA: hypothetical protein VID73_00420, partial [Ktedonobacterales bacterium]
MDSTQSNDRAALDRLLEEGRRRGYVKRAELEAIIRRINAEATPAPATGDERTPEIEELYDLDAAVDQLLAADVDIVDDDEEEARVQEDEELVRNVRAMETDSAPLMEVSDPGESTSARLRRAQAAANAADRGEAA